MKLRLERASDRNIDWEVRDAMKPVYVDVKSIEDLKKLAGKTKRIQVDFWDNTVTIVDGCME